MRSSKALGYSAAAHGLAIGALILAPMLWPSDPPVPFNAERVVLVYNPPPPPLPKGSGLTQKSTLVQEKKQEKVPVLDPLPSEEPLKPETSPLPEGEAVGVPEGMEGGVPEGMEGGVPGGVIGGTGTVTDYDQAPRLIHMVRPEQPQDAFLKRIEGKVELEIVIGANGRVERAWVISPGPIPSMNAAAIAAVMQWVFIPATKHGTPVATIARAPVVFRII